MRSERYSKELGHWKAECPKAKGKKVESNTEANLAQADGSDEDSLVFSLSVTTPTVCNSDNAEWILDSGATYHVCPNRSWFSNFEKLNGCYTVMGDDHPCNIEGMGTVRIKMDDGIVQKLKEVRYIPQLKKESYLCWRFGSIGSCDIYTRWCSQDDQRLDGGDEGRPLGQSLLLKA